MTPVFQSPAAFLAALHGRGITATLSNDIVTIAGPTTPGDAEWLAARLPDLLAFLGTVSTWATVAAAGATRATAAPLVADHNLVTSGVGGVALPAGLAIGSLVLVANATPLPVSVFPPPGAAIRDLAPDAPFTLLPGARLPLAWVSDGTWR